jgi:hypothetical protein
MADMHDTRPHGSIAGLFQRNLLLPVSDTCAGASNHGTTFVPQFSPSMKLLSIAKRLATTRLVPLLPLDPRNTRETSGKDKDIRSDGQCRAVKVPLEARKAVQQDALSSHFIISIAPYGTQLLFSRLLTPPRPSSTFVNQAL